MRVYVCVSDSESMSVCSSDIDQTPGHSAVFHSRGCGGAEPTVWSDRPATSEL